MFNKVLNSIKEGTFFEKVIHKIKVVFRRRMRNRIINSVEIDPKKVMFFTFQGKYTCNPKAIAEEFIKRDSDFKLVWVVRKEELEQKDRFPKELKLVVRNSKEFYRELASSKYVIQNANDTIYCGYNKKEGQVFFQTWHGSLGFKRLDTNNNENWVKKAHILASETDYLTSNSTFENDVFRTSYWKDSEILEIGHPRNDVLLDDKQRVEMDKYVRKYYNISPKTKIALYAPTFRDDFDFKTYDLDYKRILDNLKKRFGGKWVLMVRFHFKLRNVEFPMELSNEIINATDYYDMQDLLCAADVGITDYSSWICDYVLTGKPGFLYANDIENYINERGFYYSLNETPFPISATNDELEKNILEFDEKEYAKDRKEFLKQRGCFETGNASKLVVDKIIQLDKEA